MKGSEHFKCLGHKGELAKTNLTKDSNATQMLKGRQLA